MYCDPTGHFVLSALIIGAVIGAIIGFGIAAYIDYKDDGNIFNGSIKWYDYLGATALGGLIGLGVGIAITVLLPLVQTFLGTTFMIGGSVAMSCGAVAVSGGIAITGTQIFAGAVLLGGLISFIRIGKSGGYRFDHYYPNDHAPTHVHISGDDGKTKVDINGNPIQGQRPMTHGERKAFWKMGISNQLNNTLGSLLYQIDIFILGIMTTNTVDVSIYKVATIIPNALVFLPQCLAIYANPYFIEHNKDAEWVNYNAKKIIKYMMPIYAIITISLIACSGLIIDILYGAEYKDAVLPFVILIIGFFFTATFKSLLTNIIFCLHKIWFGVMLNIVSMIVNVILDIIFIWIFGYIGVGIATLIINIISSLIAIIYFRKCIHDLKIKQGEE